MNSQLNIDSDYIISIRRELHLYPELHYDNPATLSIIRRELEGMGIEYTEDYGKSSIVATINPDLTGYTVGLRADTDAIPVQETNDIPYKSTMDGQMHACGHDAHMAMLLGAAKALNGMKDQLACSVKLIFQCGEEGPDTGARHMVADGVMDDIDIIIAQHVSPDLKTGSMGICQGPNLAACHPFMLKFYGEAAHITLPQAGKDAAAMAVKTYNGIQQMLATEIDPFANYICGVGAIRAGQSFGIVADYAEIEGVITAYDMELDEYMIKRMEQMGKNAAEEVGGSFKSEQEITCLIVDNDIDVTNLLKASAGKVVGKDNIIDLKPSLACEDFSFFISKKPGALYWLGVRSEEKGAVNALHTSEFKIDEDALKIGSGIFVQFVLDNMRGVS